MKRDYQNHDEDVKITEGSGNVFEDLGLENAAELKLKAAIAGQINSIITHRGLNQKEAAKILGVPQPKVSRLKNGNVFGFSLEKLLEFMTRLDRDVEIGFKKTRNKAPARYFMRNENTRLQVAM